MYARKSYCVYDVKIFALPVLKIYIYYKTYNTEKK